MNTQKYYLRVNGNLIINLDAYRKYGTMTNFISLNLFTSDFDSIYEIGKELKRVGLLNLNVKVETIEIVHLYEERYYVVSSEPLFNREYQYFNEKYVNDFFYRNTRHYNAMMFIIISYKKALERKLSLKDKDDPKIEYNNILEKRLLNIGRIEVLLGNFINKTSSYYDEYYERLKEFVESEIYYKRGNKKTINYPGLFGMAKTISIAFLNYPNLFKPKIEKPTTKVANKSIPDLIDPDEYMFLESEDFMGLYGDSHKYSETLEDQIESLREKEKRL